MKTDEILSRMRELASRPPRPVREEAMSRVLSEIRRKTPASCRLFEEARAIMPGGVQHMLSPTTPYPIFMDHGRGCHLTDVDGNRYVDYLNGGGPVLLGHNPDFLRRKMAALIEDKGWFHGLPDEYEILACRKIIEHMPSVEKVRFLQSGTEACMAAIRLARACTGKKKIIKFAGTYHGWSDQLVFDLWLPGSGRLLASGIPESATENTLVAPLNDLDGLARVIEQGERDGGVAAVILEPLGPESGTLPIDAGFVRYLRELTRTKGILLIFDEVVTGFRVGLGGAQALFGVDPDLTVLGKIIGGCFPSCGAVGGKAVYMEALRSGVPSGTGPSCFVAGTFGANLLTCAAVYFTLSEIETTDAIGRAAATTEDLVNKLNRLFEREGSSFFAYRYGSILHIETSALFAIDARTEQGILEVLERKQVAGGHQTFLLNEGLMTLMGKGFVTSAHTAEAVEQTVTAYARLLEAI
ncbi:MAG: aminotransferase class III-fold pyridoxal phosphate-dependent enzyme [bacterium]